MNKCLPGKFAIILTLLLCAAFGLAGQDRIVSLSGTGNQALLNDNSDLGFYKVTPQMSYSHHCDKEAYTFNWYRDT